MRVAPIRSIMFVPGNRDAMIRKCAGAGADAVILDLEDSVPDAEKDGARGLVTKAVSRLAGEGQRTYVRINRSAHMPSFEDVMAAVRPGLEGVVLAMPCGPEDVTVAAALVAEAEARNGLAAGAVAIVPALETPRSIQLAYECALHPRVAALIGASAKGADLARAMGWTWSTDSRESLYMKSRTVAAARAAGVLPIGGIWQDVRDLDGLRDYAAADRALGMAGEAVLHPANVPVVNAVFSPAPEDVAYYRGLIEAFEAAVAGGRASTLFRGEHIDAAHAKTARGVLALAGALDPTETMR